MRNAHPGPVPFEAAVAPSQPKTWLSPRTLYPFLSYFQNHQLKCSQVYSNHFVMILPILEAPPTLGLKQ